ncbi:hypothetical protein LT337_09860 [Mycolicibacterium fortuitum]|nr:hypothetical protein LT337_09860 [Mycolicibacterium fortuitum]
MSSNEWIRNSHGTLHLTAWIDGSRVAYLAVWDISGWTLTRRVAGAASPLEMLRAERNFAGVEAAIEADMTLGL